MRSLRWVLAVALVAASMLVTGCPPPTVVCPEQALEQGELQGQYNANAAKLPQLWAKGNVDLEMLLANGQSFGWGGSALVLFKKNPPGQPADFVVIGQELAGMEIFRLGSSSQDNLEYYWFKAGDSKGGSYGRANQSYNQLPINPKTLLGLLGVLEMPDYQSLFMELRPGYILKDGTVEPCAYVLNYLERGAEGVLHFTRKMYFTWSEKEPPRVFRIDLIDSTGRAIYRAKLENYIRVDGSGTGGQQAVVPSVIDIAEVPWPEPAGTPKRDHLKRFRLSLNTAILKRGDPTEAAKLWEYVPDDVRAKLSSQGVLKVKGR